MIPAPAVKVLMVFGFSEVKMENVVAIKSLDTPEKWNEDNLLLMPQIGQRPWQWL
jgi:hypothetical protein